MRLIFFEIVFLEGAMLKKYFLIKNFWKCIFEKTVLKFCFLKNYFLRYFLWKCIFWGSKFEIVFFDIVTFKTKGKNKEAFCTKLKWYFILTHHVIYFYGCVQKRFFVWQKFFYSVVTLMCYRVFRISTITVFELTLC